MQYLTRPAADPVPPARVPRAYGLHAAGAEALGAAYDAAVQEAVDGELPDRLVRFQVEIKFFQLSVWLLHTSFQLIRPEAGEIIGDSPMVLLDHSW
ncbi:hypothetical protein [Frankia tisae]|uniref:hypothetical protein n=1 Tax=Frankia tisae TaxID=2950104 RepID=UPI0021BDFE5F|nr:hypothetical protein [Frankia tisae]